MTKHTTPEQSQLLRDTLIRTPLTYEEMCKVSGLSKARAARWVAVNRENIRIVGYGPDKNGRLFVARFLWSKGPDTPRPGRTLTPAEAMRKYRAELAKKADAWLSGK